MLCAIKVTVDNLPFITDLNEGVAPAEECLNESTYFVWGEAYSQILTEEDMEANLVVVNTLSILILKDKDDE